MYCGLTALQGCAAAATRPSSFSVVRGACAKTPWASSSLTHLGKDGSPTMVNVGAKQHTRRTAVAEATVEVGAAVGALLRGSAFPTGKGSVFGVAQLAGIMAAKRTPDLIPLCHTVPLSSVSVELELCPRNEHVQIRARAETGLAQTGVEMEALTAASVAALTVYDMCKAASKDMTISGIRLVSKMGGTSREYIRQE
jgi:cyclic pyranopterin monophosphate synthase